MTEAEEAAVRLAHYVPVLCALLERMTEAATALERALRESLEETLAQEHRRRAEGR